MIALLAIDLGGTRCRIGFRAPTAVQEGFGVEAVYLNARFSSVEEIVESFLREHGVRPTHICLAVAGVIEGQRAALTNLPWRVDAASLKARFQLEGACLINDLTALAALVPSLHDREKVVLQSGRVFKHETIGVIAPGTGLGQGYLVPAGDGHVVKGSEGGHAGFAPTNEEEVNILRWLMQTHSAVSAEMLCAGPGLTLLYKYFREEEGRKPLDWVAEKIGQSTDYAPIIVEAASAAPPCSLCLRIVNRYLAMLGSEAGNLALKLYARGGVYVGGGVMSHLLDKFSLHPFVAAFGAKGKMSGLVRDIPVFAIVKENANLHGAYHFGRTRLLQEQAQVDDS